MVVMDRVKGEMAWRAERRGELLLYAVFEDVRNATDLLHREGLVFGDLRSQNVMCVLRGDDRSGAILVDFGLSITRCVFMYSRQCPGRISPVSGPSGRVRQSTLSRSAVTPGSSCADRSPISIRVEPGRTKARLAVLNCITKAHELPPRATSLPLPDSCHPPLHCLLSAIREFAMQCGPWNLSYSKFELKIECSSCLLSTTLLRLYKPHRQFLRYSFTKQERSTSPILYCPQSGLPLGWFCFVCLCLVIWLWRHRSRNIR
ncbi:hypothetical protein OH76DRAFT_361061 [Lentinus brumalis]|uniref:Protein kinase domain-containing protein n=1 Tax=Lentinus brumalis TaxID=2498619 RepID=A0A371CJ67_9APHY|nr:hypothetical protein OH76DRAFT_361061 [Polyporus brumalis]